MATLTLTSTKVSADTINNQRISISPVSSTGSFNHPLTDYTPQSINITNAIGSVYSIKYSCYLSADVKETKYGDQYIQIALLDSNKTKIATSPKTKLNWNGTSGRQKFEFNINIPTGGLTTSQLNSIKYIQLEYTQNDVDDFPNDKRIYFNAYNSYTATLTIDYTTTLSEYTIIYQDNTGNNILLGALPDNTTVNENGSYQVEYPKEQPLQNKWYDYDVPIRLYDGNTLQQTLTANCYKYYEFAYKYECLVGNENRGNQNCGWWLTNITGNVILSPVWITPATSYYGSVILSPLTKPGYKFLYWADDNGNGYAQNYEYTPTSDNAVNFTAVWEALTYTITYDAKGGSVSPTSVEVNVGSSVTLPTPSKTGYTFEGWSTSPTATSGSTGIYTPTSDVTLYAIWSINQYEITYNANAQNGGSVTNLPDTHYKTYGITTYIDSTKPTHSSIINDTYDVIFKMNDETSSNYKSYSVSKTTDYTFKNWNTNSSDTGTSYSSDASYSTNAALSLYAIWTSSVNNARAYNPGTPSRSGYSFVGWGTSSNSTSGVSFPQTINSDTTYYAIWQQITYPYTIEFNGNGATVDNLPSSITKQGTSTSVIMGDIGNSVPIKTGYVFRGWSAKPEYNNNRIAYSANYGGSEDYNGKSAKATDSSWSYYFYCYFTGGDSSNRTLTLYAQWEKQQYTIVYDGNAQPGGTVTNIPNNSTKIYGESLSLSDKEPLHTDVKNNTYDINFKLNIDDDITTNYSTSEASKVTKYTFKNWNLKADGSSTSYEKGASYTTNSAATMYAQWNTTVINAKVNAPLTEPLREDYTFKGWGITNTATTAVSFPYEVNADTNLYAIWERNTYTITYEYYNYTGKIEIQEGNKVGEEIRLYSSSDVKSSHPSGAHIIGWSTTVPDSLNYEYELGASYIGQEDITLYGVWAYYVDYDTNGGNFDINREYKAYNQDYSISATTPTRVGYTFKQWIGTYRINNIETNELKTENYAPGAEYKWNGDLTLKADWTPISYKITYEGNPQNDGTVLDVPDNNTKYHDATDYKISSTIPKHSETIKGNGYTVTFDSKGGSSVDSITAQDSYTYTFNGWKSNVDKNIYEAGAIYTQNDKTTFTAQWKSTEVKGSITLPSSSRTGYTFKGWSTSDTATSSDYAAGDSYTPDNDITLYAVWEIANFITTITKYVSGAKQCEVYYYNGTKWVPVEEIKYYKNSEWIQVGEQIPYAES